MARNALKATRKGLICFGKLSMHLILTNADLSSSVFSARQSLDAATFRSMYNAVSPPPPSSHTQTQTQLHANMIIAPNHRKTQSLDAGHVLCATNSGGGGGNSGNIITEAAIKASATTKSMHCTRERFV